MADANGSSRKNSVGMKPTNFLTTRSGGKASTELRCSLTSAPLIHTTQ